MTRDGFREAWYALAYAVISRSPRLRRWFGLGDNAEPEIVA